jgi:hypothetical protein
VHHSPAALPTSCCPYTHAQPVGLQQQRTEGATPLAYLHL